MITRQHQIAFAVAYIIAIAACSNARAESAFDEIMYADPKLKAPVPLLVYSRRLKPLWLIALNRPEIDLKRQAAETIAQAHRKGMRGLESTAKDLVLNLKAKDQHPIVRLACARALIAIDARDAAQDLFERAQVDGLEMAQLVEPALANWNFKPIQAVWQQRLQTQSRPRRLLVLAIRGTAVTRHEDAVEPLRSLVFSNTSPIGVRLEASKSLGQIQQSALEDAAKSLLEKKSKSGVNRLLAVNLIAHHTSDRAVVMLQKRASDSNHAIAAIALQQLLRIDPQLVASQFDVIAKSRDVQIRMLACQSLSANPNVQNSHKLMPLLDDRHPELRKFVRATLIEFGNRASLSSLIPKVAMTALSELQWRGQEQAVHILVALDHQPAGETLMTLFNSERSEVASAAAWGVRRLVTLELLAPLLKIATAADFEQQGDIESDRGNAIDRLLVQLFQAFGKLKFRDSVDLLKKFIPKEYGAEQVRVAAIWALGKILEGEFHEDLVTQLIGRLTDDDEMFTESLAVRQMAAIGLGRLRAIKSVKLLRERRTLHVPDSEIGMGCSWALKELTGESMPKLKPRKTYSLNWFLTPDKVGLGIKND